VLPDRDRALQVAAAGVEAVQPERGLAQVAQGVGVGGVVGAVDALEDGERALERRDGLGGAAELD
jgi:hypothetical protein